MTDAELIAALRAEAEAKMARAYWDRCGGPDCGIASNLADAAASRLEALTAGGWRPIETCPNGATVNRSTMWFPALTTETMWVRDADGREYEAWFVRDGAYWWDCDRETDGAPVEWYPHPLIPVPLPPPPAADEVQT